MHAKVVTSNENNSKSREAFSAVCIVYFCDGWPVEAKIALPLINTRLSGRTCNQKLAGAARVNAILNLSTGSYVSFLSAETFSGHLKTTPEFFIFQSALFLAAMVNLTN
jgi:hypothetical protein